MNAIADPVSAENEARRLGNSKLHTALLSGDAYKMRDIRREYLDNHGIDLTFGYDRDTEADAKKVIVDLGFPDNWNVLDAEAYLSVQQDLMQIVDGYDVDDAPILAGVELRNSAHSKLRLEHFLERISQHAGGSHRAIPSFYDISVEHFLSVRGIKVLPEHAEAFKELKAQYHDKQCEILDEELDKNPASDETKIGRRQVLIAAKREAEESYSRAQKSGADLWEGQYQNWGRQRTRYNLTRRNDLPDDLRLSPVRHEGEDTKARRLEQFQDLVFDMDTAFNYVSSLQGTSEAADAFVELVDRVRNDIRLAQVAYDEENPARTSPASLDKIWRVAALASNRQSKSLPEHIKVASSLMAKGKIDPESLELLADSLQLVSEKLQRAYVRGVDDARLRVEVAAEVLTAQIQSYGFDRILTPDRAGDFLAKLDAVLAAHNVDIDDAADGLTRAIKGLRAQVAQASEMDAQAKAQNDNLQVGLEVLKGRLEELVV